MQVDLTLSALFCSCVCVSDRMPAPWVQLKLLQILAVLGASDKNASEGMYEILREVMKRADIGINVGYAIVYECVRTVTTIYPDAALIEDAAASISRFIVAENRNLKYLGVNALASIVQIDSKYAAEHQMVVIECLEDTDETLQRKTLDLLYSVRHARAHTQVRGMQQPPHKLSFAHPLCDRSLCLPRLFR